MTAVKRKCREGSALRNLLGLFLCAYVTFLTFAVLADCAANFIKNFWASFWRGVWAFGSAKGQPANGCNPCGINGGVIYRLLLNGLAAGGAFSQRSQIFYGVAEVFDRLRGVATFEG